MSGDGERQSTRSVIYMDHHATTPVDPGVLEEMLPFFGSRFGNPSSVAHSFGEEAGEAVAEARDRVARAIGARPEEVLFTSGATEANNLAVLGVAGLHASPEAHVVTTSYEHESVLRPCRFLASRGRNVTFVSPGRDGVVDPQAIRDALTPETALVSVMAANNEVGTTNALAETAAVVHEGGALFHTDATQAVGLASVDVVSWGADLLSLSAHKFYGPKGVGALYVRSSGDRIRLTPQLWGGGQERGLRSGTLNVPGIVGLGAAARIAVDRRSADSARLERLRAELWELLAEGVPDAEVNGGMERRLPNNLNVWFPGVDGRELCARLKPVVAVSAGSACSTAKQEPSHVLTALGLSEARAFESVRFGLGRGTSSEDVRIAAEAVVRAARALRE